MTRRQKTHVQDEHLATPPKQNAPPNKETHNDNKNTS